MTGENFWPNSANLFCRVWGASCRGAQVLGKATRKGGMSRLLIITFLDYKQEPNGRIHHVVQHMRRRFDQVTVIHGTLVEPGRSLLRTLLRCLRIDWSVQRARNFSDVRVWPLCNYSENLGRELVAGRGGGDAACWSSRSLGIEFVGVCGAIADFARMLSFLLAALWRGGWGYDVAVVQCPHSGFVGWILYSLGCVQRLVYDDIDYAPGWNRSKLRGRLCRFLEHFVMARADRVVTCGRLLKQLRETDLGREVAWIPNGVDVEAFAAARQRAPHPPTLIYMGRLVGWSGAEVAVEALRQIRREIPEARLCLVGRTEPAYGAHLRSLIQSHDLQEAVSLPGETTYHGLVQYLSQADVGLAVFPPDPMKRYAFPLKVVEYFAAGLPVIGTEGTETALLLEETGAGTVVQYAPEALAQASIRLLRDRGAWTAIARRAEAASERFHWRNLMDELYRVCAAGAVADTLQVPTQT